MDFDLNDLRTFVSVAQAGTFSAAAKELGQPTSTVSRAITRLEHGVGVLLYHRSPKGLTLTDPGRDYLRSCKQTLRSIRDGRDMLEKHRDTPSGVLRVACPITMAREVLGPVLIHFVRAFPDLRIIIEPYASHFDQEPRDDVDIFFKLKAARDSSRKVRCFPGSARALYATAEYLEEHGTPVEPMDLLQHRCIGAGEWRLTKGKKVLTPEILFHVEAGDPGVRFQLACNSAGIAILPLWMSTQPEAQKILIPVLRAWKPDPLTVCALYSGPTRVTPKVRVFLELVEKYMGTELDPRLRGNKRKDFFTDFHLAATGGP